MRQCRVLRQRAAETQLDGGELGEVVRPLATS